MLARAIRGLTRKFITKTSQGLQIIGGDFLVSGLYVIKRIQAVEKVVALGRINWITNLRK